MALNNVIFKKNIVEDAYHVKSRKQRVFAWIGFVVLFLYALSLLAPFFWLLLNSLKSERFFTMNQNGFPTEMYFQNYKTAFLYETNGNTMGSMLWNSILLCSLSTLATVITSSCAAYVVAKYKFKGRNIIYGMVVISLIVPIVGTLPSQLQLMQNIRLYNKHVGIIFIYSGGFGMNFLLLYGFFKNLSWSYAEAALVDGASDFKIFCKIMVPLAMPAITSIAVLTFVGLWNEYTVPRIFLPKHPTLSVGLFEISEALKFEHLFTVMFAAVILALIPILIIFSIFQKTIMTNTVAGGLKG